MAPTLAEHRLDVDQSDRRHLAASPDPPGATYTNPDTTANYGTIGVAAQASCTTNGNCYSVAANAPTRPVTHWDATILETVTPTSTTKTLDAAHRRQLHRRAAHQRLLPVHRDHPAQERDRRLHRDRLLPGHVHDARADGRLRARVQGAGRLRAAGLRRHADVHRRPGDQRVLPLGRRAGPPWRGRRLRARPLLPVGCRDPRADGRLRAAHPGPGDQPARVRARRCSRTSRPPAASAAGSRSWPVAEWSRAAAAATTAPTAAVTREQMGVFLAVTFGLTLYGL